MNAQQVAINQKPDASEPLFASPWIALFLVIRRELLTNARGK